MMQREKIRKYLQTLLESNVDVGGRVFFSRPDPVFLKEVPCIVFGFEAESFTIRDGDLYFPKIYIRTLNCAVDVMTNGDDDHLDYLCEQVELATANDHQLSKALDGYDPENPDGLCGGLSIRSTQPYQISPEGEHVIRACRIDFSIPYLFDVFSRSKLYKFKQFHFDILEEQEDVDVDDLPALSAGEVDL